MVEAVGYLWPWQIMTLLKPQAAGSADAEGEVRASVGELQPSATQESERKALRKDKRSAFPVHQVLGVSQELTN